MDLPAEIIEEILSRLAAKHLLRFRCVSEPWRRLIDSPKFIKTHHRNLRKNTTQEHHRVIHNRHGLGPEEYTLNSLLTESAAVPTPLDDPTISKDVNILGCCDGLLCIMNPQRALLSLWNPATRICRELPEIPEITIADVANRWFMGRFGFGWDESSGAHKVFADMFNYRLKITKTKVYSSATNSWRTLESSCDDLFYSRQSKGEFVSGKLHWNKRTTTEWFYAKGTEWIVTFDLKREWVFGRMELPCDPKGSYSSWLGEVEGRLSIVFGYKMHLDVWVMKEYEVKESWEKVVEIPLVFERDPYKSFPHVSPLWIGVDGEILVVFGAYFVVYNPRRNVRLPLKEIKGSLSLHLYVESLVSPFTHKTI